MSTDDSGNEQSARRRALRAPSVRVAINKAALEISIRDYIRSQPDNCPPGQDCYDKPEDQMCARCLYIHIEASEH